MSQCKPGRDSTAISKICFRSAEKLHRPFDGPPERRWHWVSCIAKPTAILIVPGQAVNDR
ncbi:hypothetical protein DOTSEDRAFT_146863 [Dothistroma septosporum NZE10]|uniref:Uncharacterized protein n=1 Tax=Dothistroma septosporum (strain NZE10 / CBS 128990) TaxID=675120 RepID=N1PXX4_DOTSN|nr:hypothetical protein DOTSEDRAFT_146863 [Dothistroma septosporum NZE10]